MVSFYCDFIAGWVGGCLGIVVGHPLDTVKVRQQSGNDRGIVAVMKQCIRHEGTHGFFKGLSFPILSAGALNSIFFGVYGSVLKTLDKGTGSQSTYGQIFAAGFVGGFLQLSVACPVDLIKIKLQTQTTSANTLYRGPVDALLKIFSETGIVGLYRGFWIMALRDCPSFGVYVIIYDTIMARISDRAPQAAFFSGGIAGVVSWLLIMPLDVVKSQMQADCANNPKFTGMSAAALACYRERGWRGFFKGSLAVALRAFPVNGATFVGYEYVLARCQNLDESA